MKKMYAYFRQMSIARKAMYLFLVLLFSFLLTRSLAPAGKNREYSHLIEKDSLFTSGFDHLYSHPDLLSYVKEKAYREALLELAAKDSIQLSVNLADSSVCLHINGIRIHRTKAGTFRQDRFLGSMPGIQVAGLLSCPQRITLEYATIVKMPVVERQAPKDTLEAAVNAWKPDTLIQRPAYLLLETENGIDIILEQEDESGLRDDRVRTLFHSRIYCRRAVESIGNFVMFRKQEYRPQIIMQIPARDLRAIYRALPGEAYVVIGLN